MLAIGQEAFAQANRERKTGQNKGTQGSAYENKPIRCSCGTEISRYTCENNLYLYKCPNLKCRNVWAVRLDTGGAFGEHKFSAPYLRGKYSIEEKNKEKKPKHVCKDSCVRVLVTPIDENTRAIKIRRQKTCDIETTVYVVFLKLHRTFILPSKRNEGEFCIISNEELGEFSSTNQKDNIPKAYGAVIEEGQIVYF